MPRTSVGRWQPINTVARTKTSRPTFVTTIRSSLGRVPIERLARAEQRLTARISDRDHAVQYRGVEAACDCARWELALDREDDADALDLAAQVHRSRGNPCICTPHFIPYPGPRERDKGFRTQRQAGEAPIGDRELVARLVVPLGFRLEGPRWGRWGLCGRRRFLGHHRRWRREAQNHERAAAHERQDSDANDDSAAASAYGHPQALQHFPETWQDCPKALHDRLTYSDRPPRPPVPRRDLLRRSHVRRWRNRGRAR